MKKNILQINSSGRLQGSVTRKISNLLVQQISDNQGQSAIVNRDLANGLPFVDEKWIEANFTAPEERTARHRKALSFSDSLVKEMQQADHIVIASPIYNFSIPAVLKAWVDLVARAKLTFKYTDNGPVGLLEGKKAYLVMASGGVPIGSALDFASTYLKQALAFIGINDVTIIDSSKFDLQTNDNDQHNAEQMEMLVTA